MQLSTITYDTFYDTFIVYMSQNQEFLYILLIFRYVLIDKQAKRERQIMYLLPHHMYVPTPFSLHLAELQGCLAKFKFEGKKKVQASPLTL